MAKDEGVAMSHLRPQLLGRMTQRAVVEALKARGPMSRAEISRLTGISPTTVSSAVTQVLKAGLVEEADAEAVGRGRPGKTLRLATDAAQIIGVSVEPEWCEMAVGGLDGQPHAKRHARFPTPHTYGRLLAEIERHVRRWTEGHAARTLGVGLSLPGLLDPSEERAVFSPNLHQTDDQRPGRDLRERLGLDTILLQETDALCLAERRVHRTDDLAIIDYAGGLGVGVLTGGRLLGRDLRVPRELGHVTVVPGGELCGCGNHGCLETVATDATFARLVSAKARRSLTIDEAIDWARAKKVDVREEIDRVLDYLAVAVAATTNLFAPPLIALHGRLLGLSPDLLGRLTERAAARKLSPFRGRCRLVRATTSKVRGALAGVLDHLFETLGPVLPANGPD